MKLSTPDEDPGGPVEPPSTDGSAPSPLSQATIEAPWGGETVTLQTALQGLWDTIQSNGSGADEQTERIEQQVVELEERVDDLEFTIEVLATESNILDGECPACGGRMEPTGLVNRRVECVDCESSLDL